MANVIDPSIATPIWDQWTPHSTEIYQQLAARDGAEAATQEMQELRAFASENGLTISEAYIAFVNVMRPNERASKHIVTAESKSKVSALAALAAPRGMALESVSRAYAREAARYPALSDVSILAVTHGSIEFTATDARTIGQIVGLTPEAVTALYERIAAADQFADRASAEARLEMLIMAWRQVPYTDFTKLVELYASDPLKGDRFLPVASLAKAYSTDFFTAWNFSFYGHSPQTDHVLTDSLMKASSELVSFSTAETYLYRLHRAVLPYAPPFYTDSAKLQSAAGTAVDDLAVLARYAAAKNKSLSYVCTEFEAKLRLYRNHDRAIKKFVL